MHSGVAVAGRAGRGCGCRGVLGVGSPVAGRGLFDDGGRSTPKAPDGGRSTPKAPDGGRSADIASACRGGASTTVSAAASTVSTPAPQERSHPLAAQPPQPPIQVQPAMTHPCIVADVAAWIMSRAGWSRGRRRPPVSGRTEGAGRPPSMPPPRRWSICPRDTPTRCRQIDHRLGLSG